MLSDLQIKKLTRYFQVYDIDDDGEIDAADFERVVENIRVLHGLSANSPAYLDLRAAYMGRWDGMRASADIDGDGGVDLDEWLAYWQQALEDDSRYEAEVEAITARLFHVFDTDEDGVIGSDEFTDFYGIFGLPADLARTVFEHIDPDGNGQISRDELLGVARDFYRSADEEAPGNMLFGPFGV